MCTVQHTVQHWSRTLSLHYKLQNLAFPQSSVPIRLLCRIPSYFSHTCMSPSLFSQRLCVVFPTSCTLFPTSQFKAQHASLQPLLSTACTSPLCKSCKTYKKTFDVMLDLLLLLEPAYPKSWNHVLRHVGVLWRTRDACPFVHVTYISALICRFQDPVQTLTSLNEQIVEQTGSWDYWSNRYTTMQCTLDLSWLRNLIILSL